MSHPIKEAVKRVMDEVEDLNLPDGAYWATVHEKLGLKYGEVFDIIATNKAYFNATEIVR